MALPDYLKSEFGTAIIWGEAGASGVTKTFAFDALGIDTGKMGASADLGATWDQDCYVQLLIETGTAPAAGGTVELWMACSYDNATWPGQVTGSAGAWPTTGTAAAVKLQLEFVCQLVATNDANAIQKQAPVIWRPSARYIAPVIINRMSQIVRDETTATDNDSRLIVLPLRTLIQDAA